MPEKTEQNWPRFVRTPEAARLLDLSPRTLEKHRCDGTGPIYHKLRGRVVYAVVDLEAWIGACARQSTSDAPAKLTDMAAPESADMSVCSRIR